MDLLQTAKLTGEIEKELAAAPNLKEYLSESKDRFAIESIQDLLKELYAKTRLSKAEIARRSGMSSVYLHQLFAGKRNPSRDRLICLSVGMGASLDDVQRLLRRCGYAELYARDKRDAIIIYGITHGQDLHEINDALFDENVDTLI